MIWFFFFTSYGGFKIPFEFKHSTIFYFNLLFVYIRVLCFGVKSYDCILVCLGIYVWAKWFALQSMYVCIDVCLYFYMDILICNNQSDIYIFIFSVYNLIPPNLSILFTAIALKSHFFIIYSDSLISHFFSNIHWH